MIAFTARRARTDACAWEYVPGLKEIHERSDDRENYGVKDVAAGK